jgi:hypothetical protein
LHVVWQDQRRRPAEQRHPDAEKSWANADIFASDFVEGRWSAPAPVHKPLPAPAEVALFPQLAVDGDRLVAVWSVYPEVSETGLESAVRVEWSSRPLAAGAAWAEAQVLLTREGEGQIGGRLVDLAHHPGQGVTALYGKRTGGYDLFLRRLASGQGEWSAEAPVSSGAKGNYPALAIGADGTVYAVFESYEHGYGDQVDVGAFAVPAGGAQPVPETVISPGEAGAQGRPNVAVDRDGGVWVIYVHQPRPEGGGVEVRVLRAANVPTEAPAASAPSSSSADRDRRAGGRDADDRPSRGATVLW